MNNLDRINEIAIAKGSGKLDKLKQHWCIKHILEYAYNPFKKYYITPPDIVGTKGGSDFSLETKLLLDLLIERVVTGSAAVKEISRHIKLLNPPSAEVFKRILNKDLRCGINIKSINKIYPGLIPLVFDGSIKPAFLLLRTFDPNKAKYPCLVAIKKDGIRGQFVNGRFISRQGHPFIGLDHLELELKNCPHILDGELCIDGNFDEDSGKIRDNKPTPDAVYWIFDAPSVPGTKIERYRWLISHMTETDSVKIIKHRWVMELELQTFYQRAIADGEEGVVVYDSNSEYVDGRPGTWTRRVPIKSADCPVVGFYEGKGKHKNSLGGIIIDYKGHEVKVGTGFKGKILKSQLNQLVSQVDKKLLTLKSKKLIKYSIADVCPMWLKIRQFIWDNQTLFIGVIAKVEYKENTKAGSLRQPRFKAWRWDK